MLDILKFVQGAVAKKDLVPELTHFLIKEGTIKGFNGAMTISSPIPLELEAAPRAIPFIKAIQSCKETVAISKTPTGRLSIKSGKFRALVECIEDKAFPETSPEGTRIELTKPIIPILKELLPFVGVDASRPWSNGVLLRNNSAFVTNNIVVIERWLGYDFPVECNIPSYAIKELVRIKEEPVALQIAQGSITFLYSSDKWIKCQAYATNFPDMEKILNRQCNPVALPESLFEALEAIAPFADELDRVWFKEGSITTTLQDGAAGASSEVDGLSAEGCYQVKQLLAVLPIIKTADLHLYPAPFLFFGDELRGAMVGMRT